MTGSATQNHVEGVVPFRLSLSDARGRLVRLGTTLDSILDRHDLPAAVSDLVAEAVVLTALVGSAIKLRWKLSLQIRGKGPLRLIATDYMAPRNSGETGRIRAYASLDRDRYSTADCNGLELLGEGYFAVLIDQGQGHKPYEGLTSLTGSTLSKCAETYFAQSEQIPTMFAAAAYRTGEHWRAGGMMLQQLPQTTLSGAENGADPNSGNGKQTGLSRKDDWNRLQALMATLQQSELTSEDTMREQLLLQLFHGEGLAISQLIPVQFGCSCGPEKVRQTMSIYSARDISKMTNSHGLVTADCQFCGAHYTFEPGELGREATLPGTGTNGDNKR